jgi:uncharacterized membrane protein
MNDSNRSVGERDFVMGAGVLLLIALLAIILAIVS